MALARDYPSQSCSIARSLEIVGERWTLLILRDAIFGVRKFTDLQRHLGIPRAVLSSRLQMLVEEGLLDVAEAPGQHHSYSVSSKGQELWPALSALSAWGDKHYAPNGPHRIFRHLGCGGNVDKLAACSVCGRRPEIAELEILPGPGYRTPGPDDDPVSRALAAPHTLLTPIR